MRLARALRALSLSMLVVGCGDDTMSMNLDSSVDRAADAPADAMLAVPGAPTDITAVARVGGTFDLNWTAPADSGSSPITGYSIESTPAGVSTTVAGLTLTTPALTPGTNYTFSVRAINSVGSGAPDDSSSVTAVDVPSAPTNVTATAPSGRAVASWTAADPNGSPITAYTVAASPGGASVQVAGNQTTATLTGLTNGTIYTLTVSATNAFGTGPGATSNQITANCSAASRTLFATDSATVEYGPLVQTVPEPSLFARRADNSDTRGWAKFPLTTVVRWAQVTSITLNLKVEDTAGSPSPVLEVWTSASDGWFRNMNGGTGPQPADIQPTLAVSSTFAPAPINTFQAIGINVQAHDWSTDIADGILTLGVRNTVIPPVGGFSYSQYFSSDTPGN